MQAVQINAIGVAIIVTVVEDDAAVDLSTVTTKELVFLKPDGTSSTKTASFTNSPGSDGKIQYVTQSGDLDQAGIWTVQGSVVFSGGFNGRSEIGHFEVRDNLS